MQLKLNTHKSNIGTCPHGLPLGSCPICNGMSSGGMRKADFSAKPGEMSWNECARIGAFLKAQKLAQQTRVQDAKNFAQNIKNFEKNLAQFHTKLVNLTNTLSSKLPRIISTPINFILKTTLQKPVEIVQNLPRVVMNISTKIADVASKITSVLGEIKTSIAQKISETANNIKKKIKSLFAIFETLNPNNDDKKIDEDKRIFELKTIIQNIKEKLTKKGKK